MKCLKTKIKWKEYKAYPDKIIFKSKCGSNGTIYISKTLKQFANFDFLYIKIKNKIKRFKIIEEYDRRMLRYRAHIKPIKYFDKNFTVHLKTTKQFKNILIKALNNKKNILREYTNPNFRLHIDEKGKLLFRFLINLSSKNKVAYPIAKLLNGTQKTITFKDYKKIINKFNLENKIFSPFIKNYYVKEIIQQKPFKSQKSFNPEVFRLVGLINGDGTLTKYGAYFYNNDKILHQDFITISKTLDKDLKIKKKQLKTTFKTYWYSKKIATKLNQYGTIYNRKLDFLSIPKIDKNLLAYSEYFSGIYDTEGTIIKDSNVVIPTMVTVYNKNINILNENELEYIFSLAKEEGLFKYMKDTGSQYYKLGLNKLKQNKKAMSILKKLRKHYPGLALLHKKRLDDLNIFSKLELKSIYVYFKTKTITAFWWIKINLIQDVIKFVSIINPHIKRKQQKLINYISNYVTLNDLKEIKNFMHQNGTQNLGIIS